MKAAVTVTSEEIVTLDGACLCDAVLLNPEHSSTAPLSDSICTF